MDFNRGRAPAARRFLILAVALVAVGALTACTAAARNDAAESLFIKAVNVKCKISKSEARLAWNIGNELGAAAQARQLQASARKQTEKLLAEIDRLDGPTDVHKAVSDLLAKSAAVMSGLSNGTLSVDQGKVKLEDLRRQAVERGLGECVSR